MRNKKKKYILDYSYNSYRLIDDQDEMTIK